MWEAVQSFGAILFDFFLIFAPTVGYIDQLSAIRKARRNDGFASTTSTILLVSNTLRCLYWIAGSAPFATALLLQSVWMIVVQLALFVVVLNVSLLQSVRNATSPWRPPSSSGTAAAVANAAASGATPKTARRFVLEYMAVLFVGINLALLVRYLSPSGQVASLLGYAALLVEAGLLIPQVLLNYERGSTQGVTTTLLFTWIGGDVIKLAYFLVTEQPRPFVVCSIVQLCIDVVLICQIVAYWGRPGLHHVLPAAVTGGSNGGDTPPVSPLATVDVGGSVHTLA